MYFSSLLASEEDNEYYDLLSESKYVYACNFGQANKWGKCCQILTNLETGIWMLVSI